MSTQMQTSSLTGARAWRGRAVALAAAAIAVTPLLGGCTSKQLQGGAPSYLIVDSLQGASGADPTKFGSELDSDVITLVKVTDSSGQVVEVPTIFGDLGSMTLTLGLKDPGSSSGLNTPTPTEFITVTRYHVDFARTDGHNTQGVDVPYSFDGAVTATISGQGVAVPFTLVRNQAKAEAPLKALAQTVPNVTPAGNVISTIANVTFYGTDQAGHEVSVSGSITVHFGNFADPS